MSKNQPVSAQSIDWSSRIASVLDVHSLEAIDQELESLGLGARKWRIAVAVRKRALMGIVQAHPVLAPLTPFQGRSNSAFAKDFGIPAVDGRRLHAYRLDQQHFANLEHRLATRKSYDAIGEAYNPAFFVLWASEWFRRSYRGGMRRWEDITNALGLPPPGPAEQNMLRKVTRQGLRQWDRPIYSSGMNHFLATLAREGGFPACAVADGGQGWAKAVLETIVRQLMGAPEAGEDEALEFAKSQAAKFPGVFSDAEFIMLCADLALAIVQLRREFEPLAQAAGIPLAAWLGLNAQDWRERLPLSTGDTDADALVETLISVQPLTGAHVGVDRLLVRDGNFAPWCEAVRIGLEGEVSGGMMASVDAAFGRLRAFAAGPMARYLPGELALFDPPGLGETTWLARSGRHARGILPLPFECPVQFDLRAGERPVARIDIPGGKPRRGQLLVAARDDAGERSLHVLRILGSGSGSYRSTELYIIVPQDWAVLPVDQGTAIRLDVGVGDKAIWHVSGGARLVDPYNDSYQVLCGQATDQTARIHLIGNSPVWAETKAAVDLFIGSPQVTRERAGDLVMRQVGLRNWRPTPRALSVGHYEIGWRKDGIMLDRRRIAVLPQTAEVRTVHLGTGVEFCISGFDDVRILPSADAPVRPTSDGDRWLPRAQSAGVYRFDAMIEWPDGAVIPVSIAYPGEACIARWDGRTLGHRTQVTLDDMRDLVAIDRGDMQLMASLRDIGGSVRADMLWSFSREMPMSAVVDDIASLLLPASLDAEVVLDMNDSINTNWIVRKFPLELHPEGTGFVASKGVVAEGVELCGRSIADPARETSFGYYTLLSDANHRPATLPEATAGDWLVFLRHGDCVLTRPKYFSDGNQRMEPVGSLGHAMAQPFGLQQDQSLRAFLAAAATDDEEGSAALNALIELTATLRGLPPETFNVYKHLHHFPSVLARMAFHASEAQRDAIVGLSLALPFAWFAIPLTCWQDAQQSAGRAAMNKLSMLTDAPRYAVEIIQTTKQALIDRLPLLRPLLGTETPVSLEEAAQAFLRRARDRIPRQAGDRYRARLGDHLPAYFLRFDATVLDALDAPCAAALAVEGLWTPDSDDIRHLKLAARSYPTWFSQAFAASVKERI